MMRLQILAIGLIVVGILAVPTHAQLPPLHRAGLVVVHSDGSIFSACVAFPEESIDGADLLRRSGLEVTLGAYGGLGYGVCAIGGEGCPAGKDCFCQCRGNPCAYWVYSHRRPDGSWAISGVGASGWQVRDGDVDGWVWGDGSTAPPVVTFEQVCPAEAVPPATPTLVSELSPRTVTPVMSPTITSAPPPLLTAPPATPTTAGPYGDGSSPLGYVVFGVVAIGLVGWLVVVGTRGSRA